MPTYEYQCEACGHQFEEIQKIVDPPIDRCPKCKKKKARRLISQGNFILKGGGWYVTDYAARPKKTESSEKSTAGTKADTAPKATDATPSDGASKTTPAKAKTDK